MNRLSFLLACIFLLSSFSKPLKWVAIGDSITYLNDHHDETGNRITKGYLTLLTERFPDLQVVNKGFNGWTAMNIAAKFETLAIDRADVYTIFLGTNDWWQGRPAGTLSDYKNDTGTGTVSGSFRVIIDRLRALNKSAHIILITPLQRGDFVYVADMKNNAYGSYKPKNGQHLEQIVNAIRDIGKLEKLDVVDLYHDSGVTLDNMVAYKRMKDPATGKYRNYKYPEYVDVPFDPEKDEYPYPADATDMTYDGLHPSDKGYSIIAGMLSKVIMK